MRNPSSVLGCVALLLLAPAITVAQSPAGGQAYVDAIDNGNLIPGRPPLSPCLSAEQRDVLNLVHAGWALAYHEAAAQSGEERAQTVARLRQARLDYYQAVDKAGEGVCVGAPRAVPAVAPEAPPSEQSVLAEINAARTDPAGYAQRLAQGPRTPAAETAIEFLKRQAPLPPLKPDDRLATAAAGHAADDGPIGVVSHDGPDGSNPMQRMQRTGVWTTVYGEMISLGQGSAAGVVRQLILDQGVEGFPHRADLFTADFRLAGVGCGPHKAWRTMCVIDMSADRMR